MRVQEIMTSAVVVVALNDNLKIADDIMRWKHIRHLPVVDEDNNVVGLITHRDLLRVCVSTLADISSQEQDSLLRGIPVQEVMRKEVEMISPDADVKQAARRMLDRKIGCLVVTEGRRLAGILTEADFVRYLLEILN